MGRNENSVSRKVWEATSHLEMVVKVEYVDDEDNDGQNCLKTLHEQ